MISCDFPNVDSRSRGCSHLLALSARHRHIMIHDEFWWIGCQQQEDMIEVRCHCKISQHWSRYRQCRGQVHKQASLGGVYGDIMIDQQSSLYVSSNPSGSSHSWAMITPQKHPKKTQQRWRWKNTIVLRGKQTYYDRMTKNLKMNGMA